MTDRPLRFGVVGTGFWARATHAAGIAAAEGAELAGVWGRDLARSRALAADFGVPAFATFAELLDTVDAVSFSVPPDVQVRLAVEAASKGKHLLLEKPVATSPAAARGLAGAVDAAGVSTVVFVTAGFTPERSEWSHSLRARGPWRGASAVWLAATFADGSRFDTPWRHEKGALWDLGPHLLLALGDALGPVEDILAAARGEGDLVHLVLRHEGGATSTATLSLGCTPAGSRMSLDVWGDAGTAALPISSQPSEVSLARAATELARAAATGSPHRLDVHAGVRAVELLAKAEALSA